MINELLLTGNERHRVVTGKVRQARGDDPLPRILSRNVEDALLEAQITKCKAEEFEFLDKILHMPFFEFCLLVKERTQVLGATK